MRQTPRFCVLVAGVFAGIFATILVNVGSARCDSNVTVDKSLTRFTRKTLVRLPVVLPGHVLSGHRQLIREKIAAELESSRFRFYVLPSVSSLESGQLATIATWADKSKIVWACQEEVALRKAQSLVTTRESDTLDCEDPAARDSLHIEKSQTDAVLRSLYAYQTVISAAEYADPCIEIRQKHCETCSKETTYLCSFKLKGFVRFWNLDATDIANGVLTAKVVAVTEQSEGSGGGSQDSRSKSLDEAVGPAATHLAARLAMSVRTIEDFRLRSPIEGQRLKDGFTGPVQLDMGIYEGVKVGDWFDVTLINIDGKTEQVGHVRLVTTADNRPRKYVTNSLFGEPNVLSEAEIITNANVVRGSQVVEHPMAGWSIRPVVGMNMVNYSGASLGPKTVKNQTTNQNVGIEIENDLSGGTEIPGFSFISELFLNPFSDIHEYSLEFGVRKTIFLRRLMAQIGLQGGAERLSLAGTSYDTYTGIGRGVFGLGWFVTPEFQFGIQSGYRYIPPIKSMVGDNKADVATTSGVLDPSGPFAYGHVTFGF